MSTQNCYNDELEPNLRALDEINFYMEFINENDVSPNIMAHGLEAFSDEFLLSMIFLNLTPNFSRNLST